MKTGYAVAGPFLPAAVCDAVLAEAEHNATWRWSEVEYDGRSQVNRTFRSGQWREVPRSCDALIAGRVLDVAHGLVPHFGRLQGVQGPNVLRYQPGDFFRTHQDEHPASGTAQRRKVTVVAFLNDRGFSGGLLRLDDLGGGSVPLTVSPRKGRFVAFSSDAHHGVSPITGGVRYTLVWWYY